MGYKLKVTLRAELEVAMAVEYYLEINELLPHKILDNVESAYDHLRQSPYFQKRYGKVRGLPIVDFPYVLLFIIDEDRNIIKVLSCFHTYQNPKKYPD